MLSADYVIVGSGLTGATIARTLTDVGREVVVLERREHLGGNVHDQIHSCGVRYHTYGPHYFRTNSKGLWEWVQRFSPFYCYEAKVCVYLDGEYHRWPLRTDAQHLRAKIVDDYNRKMWGTDTPPREVTSRVELRKDDNDLRLKTERYQGLPQLGYTGFINNLLKGIQTLTAFDYLRNKDSVRARKKLIFTGPIDEYYGFSIGRLAYRAQRRKVLWFHRSFDRLETPAQINRPNPQTAFIRSIEWNKLAEKPDYSGGCLMTYEYPYSPLDPNNYEYPYNDDTNRTLYLRYRAKADAEENLLICGRLGSYRYLDMDQTIARALVLAKKLLSV